MSHISVSRHSGPVEAKKAALQDPGRFLACYENHGGACEQIVKAEME